MSVRPTFLSIHRWAGLTLGLIVLASAFTGAGMAFRKQLEPVLYPHLVRAPECHAPLPLDTFARAAVAANQSSKLDYLRVQGDTSSPINARFLNKDTLFFDRCTGRQVGSQNRYSGLFGTLEWIHRGRWSSIGEYVMGSGALTLLFVLASIGLYLWWPRGRRRLVDGLILSRKLKGPAFNIGLHRTAGAWVAIPLLISAATGLPNAFSSVHNSITSLDGPAAHTPASLVPLDHSSERFPLASAWDTITRLTPNPEEVLIHVGQVPSDPLEIYIIERDAPHANARSYLFLDAFSGRVLSFTPYRDMGVGSKLYFWTLSIHTGEVGGILGQLLLFIGATGALLLGYTGITSYVRRRFKLNKKTKRSMTARASVQDEPAF